MDIGGRAFLADRTCREAPWGGDQCARWCGGKSIRAGREWKARGQRAEWYQVTRACGSMEPSQWVTCSDFCMERSFQWRWWLRLGVAEDMERQWCLCPVHNPSVHKIWTLQCVPRNTLRLGPCIYFQITSSWYFHTPTAPCSRAGGFPTGILFSLGPESRWLPLPEHNTLLDLGEAASQGSLSLLSIPGIPEGVLADFSGWEYSSETEYSAHNLFLSLAWELLEYKKSAFISESLLIGWKHDRWMDK